MKTSDFYYDLPENLIAQTPLEDRSSSRMMVVDRKTGDIFHKQFVDILNEVHEGDVLVLNDTKVMPARLIGKKEETNAVIELLLLKPLKKDRFECLMKPAKRIRVGTVISFGDLLKATCILKKEDGIGVFEFAYEGVFYEILDQLGTMPLPPYIHEKLKDQNRYQTVYASCLGSAAAPTAGLHFTEEILEKLAKKKVEIEFVTLHVGLGTFRPVKVSDVKNHQMHEEVFEMTSEVAKKLNQAKKEGRRIVAVGTTSVRTLETVYHRYGKFQGCKGKTDIFIYPGYTFLAVDALLTNFHLPESTLVMLVSAFATREIILHAYQEAVKEKYRFFSFGDAMFLR